MTDLEATRRQLDEANSEIRQLLQQRKGLRAQVRDAEDAARSMRERAVAVAGEAPNHPQQWPAVAIRDLPLLPDDGDALGPTHADQVAGLIPEITCVECLQTIAMNKGAQAIRYRTAWESARAGRAQARLTANALSLLLSQTRRDRDAARATTEQGPAPRDSDLIQQVRALVKRHGAPWVAYEAARQARH